jgi:hypothetical protein
VRRLAARCLDDAVEGDELRNDQGAHGRSSLCGSGVGPHGRVNVIACTETDRLSEA